MDRRVEQMLEIATRILEEGRTPTEEERAQFHELHKALEKQPEDWRLRFSGLVNRFAEALESMGI